MAIDWLEKQMDVYHTILKNMDDYIENPIQGWRNIVILMDSIPSNQGVIAMASDRLYKRTINVQNKKDGYLQTVKELLQTCKDSYDSCVFQLLKMTRTQIVNGNSQRNKQLQVKNTLCEIDFTSVTYPYPDLLDIEEKYVSI